MQAQPHAAPLHTSSSLIAEADAIVCEYLVFRGFSSALSAFQHDAKLDTYGNLSARRLSQRLVAEVEGLSLEGVLAWWHDGIGQILARLDEESATLGRALRDSTLRWFCVEAVKKQRVDLVLNFFKSEWTLRVGSTRFRDEWRRQWFALPYTASPERDRYFAVYFSPEWRDSVVASVENFLSAVFQSLPPPRLLALATTADTIAQLRAEVSMLKSLQRTASNASAAPTSPSRDGPRKAAEPPEVPLAHREPPPSASLIGRLKGPVARVRVSPSSELVAACGEDATALVFARPNWVESATVFLAATVTAMDWHDDATLALGTSDSVVKVWSLRGGKAGQLRTSGLLPRVVDVRFNPSSQGAMLAVSAAAAAKAATAGELQMWNVVHEKLERTLGVDVASSAVQFNHNGSLLVAAGCDGVVRVFDAARNEAAIMSWPAAPCGLCGLAFNAAETSVFTVDAQGQLKEWSMHNTVGDALTQVALPWAPGARRCDAAVWGRKLALAVTGEAPLVLDDGKDPHVAVAGVSAAAAVDWDDGKLLVGCDDGSVLACSV